MEGVGVEWEEEGKGGEWVDWEELRKSVSLRLMAVGKNVIE